MDNLYIQGKKMTCNHFFFFFFQMVKLEDFMPDLPKKQETKINEVCFKLKSEPFSAFYIAQWSLGIFWN